MVMPGTRATPKLLAVGAVAERLNVSKPTVYRLISAGVIPALRIGNALRVDACELELWLRANHASPVSDDGLRQEQLRAGAASPERREASVLGQSTSPADAGPGLKVVN
jgi:excisionase family DNA binding protein